MKVGLKKYMTFFQTLTSVALVVFQLHYKNYVVFFLCNNIFSIHFGLVGSVQTTWTLSLFGDQVGKELMTDAIAGHACGSGIIIYIFDYIYDTFGMLTINIVFIFMNITIIEQIWRKNI